MIMCSEKEKIYFIARIIQSNKNFDAIQFLTYIDFVEFDECYYDNVLDLVNRYYGDNGVIYKTIKEYMTYNYIKEIAPLDFESLYEAEVYINNVLITQDIVNKVLEYMKVNNYPMINYIYSLLISRYVRCGLF